MRLGLEREKIKMNEMMVISSENQTELTKVSFNQITEECFTADEGLKSADESSEMKWGP